MTTSNDLSTLGIVPDWPAPAQVRCVSTMRTIHADNGFQGASRGVYAGFNLGDHVGDDPAAVAANRAWLAGRIGGEPRWLRQVHGVRVVDAAQWTGVSAPEADAAFARQPGVVCAVMTADCLPALLCDAAGSVVAAVHAGWRGLLGGVLEAAVAAMDVPGERLLVWLGPAIGPRAFEVGAEVRAAFVAADAASASAFRPAGLGSGDAGKPDEWRNGPGSPGALSGLGRSGSHDSGFGPNASEAFVSDASGAPLSDAPKYLADIYGLACQRLARVGVRRVFGGGWCTVSDAGRFFSYRRDGTTGRMATLIWLESEA